MNWQYPCGFKLNTVMAIAVALIRTENNWNWYDLSLQHCDGTLELIKI